MHIYKQYISRTVILCHCLFLESNLASKLRRQTLVRNRLHESSALSVSPNRKEQGQQITETCSMAFLLCFELQPTFYGSFVFRDKNEIPHNGIIEKRRGGLIYFKPERNNIGHISTR